MMRANAAVPRRGELWWIVLDPVQGYELGGHVPGEPRPALVVSSDEMMPTGKLIVVPATSRERPGLPRVPFSWRLGARTGTSYLCCDDVRAVSIERLRGPLAPGIGAPAFRAPSAVIALVARLLLRLLALDRPDLLPPANAPTGD